LQSYFRYMTLTGNFKGLEYVKSAGIDDRILWLHGYTMDTRVWEEIWDAAPGFGHIGVNLPGHGPSLLPSPPEGLRDLALRLNELAHHMNVHHLVGLSFGGMIACQMAIEHPTYYKTLISASAILTGVPPDHDVKAKHGELITLYRSRGRGPWLTELWMRSPPNIFRSAEANPALFNRLREIIDEHKWLELQTGANRALTAHIQTPEDLKTIEARTLAIVGADDLPAAITSAALIKNSVSNSQLRSIEGAGHLALLERPQECAAYMYAYWTCSDEGRG
jgi:pimeloyl-ACP methyl ester carboxylesterase